LVHSSARADRLYRHYADGSVDKHYHFDAALHPRFTPLICGLSMMAALSGAHEVPPINTVDYDVKIEFANVRSLTSRTALPTRRRWRSSRRSACR